MTGPECTARRSANLGRPLFAAVLALSLVILFTPASAVPDSPPGTDKLVHFCLFAALALSAVLAGLGARRVLLLGWAYAALSEAAQALLTGLHRSGGVLDWVADAAGVLAGLAALALLARVRSPR